MSILSLLLLVSFVQILRSLSEELCDFRYWASVLGLQQLKHSRQCLCEAGLV
ncbi:hypothetical protein M758_UG242400 [Ceratodon purpureus]|nr:hypothetical protein M758_UG242400 [Ceratodon purpureus]